MFFVCSKTVQYIQVHVLQQFWVYSLLIENPWAQPLSLMVTQIFDVVEKNCQIEGDETCDDDKGLKGLLGSWW